MSNINNQEELNHFLRLQQFQQQQQAISDNTHDNDDARSINYDHDEVQQQETRRVPHGIQQLAHAQQNALDLLENVVRNQQMLHGALRDGGTRRPFIHEEEREGDANQQDSNQHEDTMLQRQNDRLINQGGIHVSNGGRSFLIHAGLGILLSMLVLKMFGFYSNIGGSGNTLEHDANDLHNAGISAAGDTAHSRLFDQQATSFEAVLEASGNTFINNHPDGWEVIMKKFHAKKDSRTEKAEEIHSSLMYVEKSEAMATSTSSITSKGAPNADHSAMLPGKIAPKATPSTSDSLDGQFKNAWRNFRRSWNVRYQILLEKLEEDPYTLSLTPTFTVSGDNENNEQEGTSDKLTRSIVHPLLYFMPHTMNHSKPPTMMKTRERLRSIGFGENTNGINLLLCTCFQYIEAIMKFCEGGGKDDDHTSHESDFLFERLIGSTPRLLAIANTFLVLTYLLHGAIADFFLGSVNDNRAGNPPPLEANGIGADRTVDDLPGTRRQGGGATAADQTRRHRRVGRERFLGYLLFKVVLISAVVEPDTLDLLVLLLWYSVLSFLRSLSHVAGSTINHAAHSGQPPCLGALLLLIFVLVCDGLAVIGSVTVFHDSGWRILLLLTCDCLLIGTNATSHIVRHVNTTLEEKHRARIAELEASNVAIHNRRRELNSEDVAAVERLEEESRSCDQEVEIREAGHARRVITFEKLLFSLELIASFVTAAHFLHIWTLHGASFGLVDCVLLLHLQSTLTSAGRKIAERRNLNRILREIDETFNDASDFDIRKASTSGDVCCVCLVTMTTGNVKKLCCGHLFHKNCLKEVVERARSLRASKCPLCRASLVDGINAANNIDIGNAVNIDSQPQRDSVAQGPTLLNNQQTNQTVNEQSLFRFSTEGILPTWLPVPAFAFEVVRRETPVLAEQNNGSVGGLRRFFRRGAEEDAANGNQVDGQQAQERQPSFWRRLFVLAGAIPMSPEEEAAALEQLVDMFPQYDRGDLSRELQARGSAEAVVESVLLGVFSGTPRGMEN